MTGTVFQTQLPKILIKFREDKIEFAADIEAMFSRVRLTPEDARFHRFLWKEAGNDDVGVIQMNRLSFGDKCSPFVAISVVHRVAEDYGKDHPEATNAIRENYYLDSTETTDGAVRLAQDVRNILAAGDFHLRNWTSKFN